MMSHSKECIEEMAISIQDSQSYMQDAARAIHQAIDAIKYSLEQDKRG